MYFRCNDIIIFPFIIKMCTYIIGLDTELLMDENIMI